MLIIVCYNLITEKGYVMKNIEMKQFDSENFNWSEQSLKNFLPMFEGALAVMPDVDLSEGLTLSDLAKPIPNKKDKDYDKQVVIHHLLDLIDDKDSSKIFLLYADNKPVSIALFSADKEFDKAYILEAVQTAKDSLAKGYAKELLKQSFNALKESTYSIGAVVEEENYASIELNKSLGTYYKVTKQENKYVFRHVINDNMLKLIKQKEEENEL